MPRKSSPPPCTEKDRLPLKEWPGSQSIAARLVERARMICRLLDGESVSKVVIDLRKAGATPERKIALYTDSCKLAQPSGDMPRDPLPQGSEECTFSKRA